MTIMDDFFVLNDIPFSLDATAIMKRLHIGTGGRYAGQFSEIAGAAMDIAKPKAIYRAVCIESREDNTIAAGGVMFKSRVLRVNLEKADRIFPFAATCGTEIDEWSSAFKSVLHQLWIDGIKQAILFSATNILRERIIDVHKLGKTAEMSPGEIEDWPIVEQRPLFSLLGDTKKAIGLSLSSGCMMQPVKSRSGILFPTEGYFESCMLCSQPACPGRKAPYDKYLYDIKYHA